MALRKYREGKELHNEFMIFSWSNKNKIAEADLDTES